MEVDIRKIELLQERLEVVLRPGGGEHRFIAGAAREQPLLGGRAFELPLLKNGEEVLYDGDRPHTGGSLHFPVGSLVALELNPDCSVLQIDVLPLQTENLGEPESAESCDCDRCPGLYGSVLKKNKKLVFREDPWLTGNNFRDLEICRGVFCQVLPLYRPAESTLCFDHNIFYVIARVLHDDLILEVLHDLRGELVQLVLAECGEEGDPEGALDCIVAVLFQLVVLDSCEEVVPEKYLDILLEGDLRVGDVDSLLELLPLSLLPLECLGSGPEALAGGVGMVVVVEAYEVAVTLFIDARVFLHYIIPKAS